MARRCTLDLVCLNIPAMPLRGSLVGRDGVGQGCSASSDSHYHSGGRRVSQASFLVNSISVLHLTTDYVERTKRDDFIVFARQITDDV